MDLKNNCLHPIEAYNSVITYPCVAKYRIGKVSVM